MSSQQLSKTQWLLALVSVACGEQQSNYGDCAKITFITELNYIWPIKTTNNNNMVRMRL